MNVWFDPLSFTDSVLLVLKDVPPLKLYWYGAVPVVGTAIVITAGTLVLVRLQLNAVALAVATNGVGWVMVTTVAEEIQLLLSLTTTLYVLAAKPLKVFDVWKAPPLILYS